MSPFTLPAGRDWYKKIPVAWDGRLPLVVCDDRSCQEVHTMQRLRGILRRIVAEGGPSSIWGLRASRLPPPPHDPRKTTLELMADCERLSVGSILHYFETLEATFGVDRGAGSVTPHE